ncbi:ABC transporter transmembrane domain-containing protein [Nonomuraea sp. NPDC048826]|uniref:ABC transporter transmembrane domain-containing protein n=1 Tax=Nonomuraea sp. NPDC048826 TaxID=3364347 RepID=UPI003713A1E7
MTTRRDLGPGGSSPWRFVFRGVTRNKARMAGFLLLLTLWQLCETLVPVLIGLIIDRAVATSDWTWLALGGAALLVLFGVLSSSYRFGSRLGFGVIQRERHRLRTEIARHALDARGVRTDALTGETLSLATSDTDSMAFALRSLGYSLASAASLALSAWVLLGIHTGLGLVVLLGVPLVMAAVQVLTPLVSRRTRDQQAGTAHATGIATDLVRGLRVLQGIGAEDRAAARYRGVSRRARIAGIRGAESHGAMLGLTSLLSGGFLALVAFLAGDLALAGEITVGGLVTVVGLSQYLAEPIEAVGGIGAQAAQAHASAVRILGHLTGKPLVEEGTRALPPTGAALRVEGLTGRRLSGLRVVSRPGEMLGLAVEDPVCASELMDALALGSASITLGGVPLDQLSTEARRAHLVVSPHHVDLFEGTVRGNVDPAGLLDDAAFDAVLSASAADDAAGPDRPVTSGGAAFSGGQRQRVALARALASRAPILVLHDPTTAVDAVTEHRIADGIRDLRHPPGGGLITWLVTCSPALLARCDRVLQVRDGAVVAEGAHRDLSAAPDYRELVLR